MPLPSLPLRATIVLLLSSSLSLSSLAAQLTHAQPALPSLQSAATPVPQANNARDALLITSVEQAYAAGLASYQAGNGDQARQQFDHAVDLLLTSGIDIKSNPALSAELDRVVDSINTLQIDALRQGAPLSPQEEAPVDVANDVTFPTDPNVTAKAQAELKTTQSDLPLVINDYVSSYISFFSNTPRGRATITGALERAGRYKKMIQRVLKEEGVPQDLLYQAVAESGFRPQAVNPKSGAAGMWQFMPFGTYGLSKTGWYDERFDPEKSTRAYAEDIKKTYAQLGDWYLAMAAYDWGTGNIQRAVQRTGYVDFWELYRRNNLPQETKNYVPIILAVAIMAKNPKQYGLESISEDSALDPETVVTNYAVSLQLVADITGSSLETIEALNPSLLRGRTPPDESFDLHIPTGTAALFNQRIAEVPENERGAWRFHVLAPGDTLETVASTFHTTASEIAFTNQLNESADLSGVTSLVIPVAPPRVAAERGSSSVYRVRRGDTLVNIADQFGVSVASLERWNHLRGGRVTVGRKLYVAEPARISHTQTGSRHAGSARSRHARGSSRRGTAAHSAHTTKRRHR